MISFTNRLVWLFHSELVSRLKPWNMHDAKACHNPVQMQGERRWVPLFINKQPNLIPSEHPTNYYSHLWQQSITLPPMNLQCHWDRTSARRTIKGSCHAPQSEKVLEGINKKESERKNKTYLKMASCIIIFHIENINHNYRVSKLLPNKKL